MLRDVPSAPSQPSDPALLHERFRGAGSEARRAVAFAQFERVFGARFSVNATIRQQHGRGEARAAALPPDAVVWPETTAEVAAILRTCAEQCVPVVAFGAGSSLEGHVTAPYGGVCVDFSRMDRLVTVNAEDADCVVEPGITREALNAALRDTGLCFTVDPGANASIGGMIATRASGTTTLRYGSIQHNLLALEVVTADGEVIRCGTRARKSSAGYDLVRLFAGSEGTLGLITQATLRLRPLPGHVTVIVAPFPTLRAAVDTVTELTLCGLPLARMEFIDEHQVRACNRHSGLGLAEQPTLFLELHGDGHDVASLSAEVEAVAREHGATGFETASRPEERTRLWKARHAAYYAALGLRPGCECVVADVCVPVSRLADAVADARRDIEAAGLVAPILGHVGDGNFHVLFLLEPGNAAERERADAVYAGMIDRALAVGGTCTGEHGIGLGKRQSLEREAGVAGVGLMRRIKLAWDPLQILNPGKIFPDR
jgi:D-lactate dehydrogenase (cytochrome)